MLFRRAAVGRGFPFGFALTGKTWRSLGTAAGSITTGRALGLAVLTFPARVFWALSTVVLAFPARAFWAFCTAVIAFPARAFGAFSTVVLTFPARAFWACVLALAVDFLRDADSAGEAFDISAADGGTFSGAAVLSRCGFGVGLGLALVFRIALEVIAPGWFIALGTFVASGAAAFEAAAGTRCGTAGATVAFKARSFVQGAVEAVASEADLFRSLVVAA